MNRLRMFLSRCVFVTTVIVSALTLHAEQISIDELAEALLSQMSPEEQQQLLRETEELFQSLSPEELMELGRASEDFLREELKKEGLDLLPVDQSPQQKNGEEPQKPATEPLKPAPSVADKELDQPIVQIDSKLLDRAKAILKDIVDMIDEIDQQAENQRIYKQQMDAIRADFELLSSMLNIVNQNKLVSYFADDEHKNTYEHIVTLYNRLNQHIDAFKPEATLDKSNPYYDLGLPTNATFDQVKKQYAALTREYDPERIREKAEKSGLTPEAVRAKVAKARKKFNTVVDSFQRIQTQSETEKAFSTLYRALRQALYTNNITEGLKNILEAHAPQALKQAEAAEKRAEAARKAQEAAARQYPSYSPMVFERQPTPPRMTPQDYARIYGTPQPPAPSAGKPTPPKPIEPTKSADQKEGGKKDGGDKKKDDAKKPEQKIIGEKTFYQALGIGQNANLNQIKQAYQFKRTQYSQADTDALKDWPIIKDAYDILLDPELRKVYDKYLKEYFPKEAREKIKEYQKTLGERSKRDEERGKKVDEAQAGANVQSASQARDLFGAKINTSLQAATNQLSLKASDLTTFDTFLTRPYDANDINDIVAVKNAISRATTELDATIKALQNGRANKLLQDNPAEFNVFVQQALTDIAQFLNQNRAIIDKLKATQATGAGAEKQYIFFGIPYAPPQPTTAQVGTPAFYQAQWSLASHPTPSNDIKNANPQRVNYVGNFVNKVRDLESLASQLQPASNS